MCQIVRVKFMNGSECLSDKFRDLYVRSRVVIAMASIYIERHIDDLQTRQEQYSPACHADKQVLVNLNVIPYLKNKNGLEKRF